MRKKPFSSDDFSSEEQLKKDLAAQLNAKLNEMVAAHLLTEQFKRILALRMGLEDGTCYTLNEVAQILARSPEWIRGRQHFALKACTNDADFQKLLGEYDRIVKLPRGLTYYIYRYKYEREQFQS
jgi:DNA-directed RNA polymerase sigma subunit (sigma70/sigma32)